MTNTSLPLPEDEGTAEREGTYTVGILYTKDDTNRQEVWEGSEGRHGQGPLRGSGG